MVLGDKLLLPVHFNLVGRTQSFAMFRVLALVHLHNQLSRIQGVFHRETLIKEPSEELQLPIEARVYESNFDIALTVKSRRLCASFQDLILQPSNNSAVRRRTQSPDLLGGTGKA